LARSILVPPLACVLSLCVSACLEPNPSHDGLDATGSATSAATGASSTMTGSTEAGSEGASASADGSSTTTGQTGSATDSTETGDTTGSTGGTGESLWHYNDEAECLRPLWCFQTGNGVFTPVGVPLRAFECFHSELTPPIDINKFAYVVVARDQSLADFQLQVRELDPSGGPGGVIDSIQLSAATYGTVTTHSVDVGIAVDTQDFCIGLETTGPGLAAALGLAVDETASMTGVSYVQLQSGDGGVCDMAAFEDVITADPTPAGNWCFSVSLSN
jgi:hypothetical protein